MTKQPPWPWADPDAEIVFIEFYEGHRDAPGRLIPFEAIVRERDGNRVSTHSYDCEFCKRDGTILYRCSGSGLFGEVAHVEKGGPFWAARGVKVEHHRPKGQRGRRLLALPPEYSAWPFRDGSDLEEYHDTFAWCTECGCLPARYGPYPDEVDEDETPAEIEDRRRPCPHLVWDAEYEEWTQREAINAGT